MYDFIDIGLELRKYCIDQIILSPEKWKTYINPTPLDWHVVRFNKEAKNQIPNDKGGVYSFVLKPNIARHTDCSYLLYIGKAKQQSLRKRFLQYFSEKTKPKGRPRVQRMLVLWEEYLWFCYSTVDDTDQISTIERDLIGAYVPPINDDYPAEIRQAMKAW
jgi:hypothetical protein